MLNNTVQTNATIGINGNNNVMTNLNMSTSAVNSIIEESDTIDVSKLIKDCTTTDNRHYPVQFNSMKSDIETFGNWTEQDKCNLYTHTVDAIRSNATYRNEYTCLISKSELTSDEYKKLFELTKPLLLLYLTTNSLSSYDVEALGSDKFLYADGTPITDMFSIISIAYKESQSYFTIAAQYDKDILRIFNTADALQEVGYISKKRKSIWLRPILDDTNHFQYPKLSTINQTEILYITHAKLIRDIPHATKYTNSNGELIERKLLCYKLPFDAKLNIKFIAEEFDVVKRMIDKVNETNSVASNDNEYLSLVNRLLLKYGRQDIVNKRDCFYKVRTSDKYDIDNVTTMYIRLVINKLKDFGINCNDFRSNNRTCMSINRLATYGAYILLLAKQSYENVVSNNPDLAYSNIIAKLIKTPLSINFINSISNDMLIFDNSGIAVANGSTHLSLLRNDRLCRFANNSVLHLSKVENHEYSGYESTILLDYEELDFNLKALDEHTTCVKNTIKDLVKISVVENKPVVVIGPTDLKVTANVCNTNCFSFTDYGIEEITQVTSNSTNKDAFSQYTELVDQFKAKELGRNLSECCDNYSYAAYKKKNLVNLTTNVHIPSVMHQAVEKLLTDTGDADKLKMFENNVTFVDCNGFFNNEDVVIKLIGSKAVYVVDTFYYAKSSIAEMQKILGSTALNSTTLQAVSIKRCLDHISKINSDLELHLSRNIESGVIDKLFTLYSEVTIANEPVYTTDDKNRLPEYFDQVIKKPSDYTTLVRAGLMTALEKPGKRVIINLSDCNNEINNPLLSSNEKKIDESDDTVEALGESIVESSVSNSFISNSDGIINGAVVKGSKYTEVYELNINNCTKHLPFIKTYRLSQKSFALTIANKGFELLNFKTVKTVSEVNYSEMLHSADNFVEDSYEDKQELDRYYNFITTLCFHGKSITLNPQLIKCYEDLLAMPTRKLIKFHSIFSKRRQHMEAANGKVDEALRRWQKIGQWIDEPKPSDVKPYPNCKRESQYNFLFIYFILKIRDQRKDLFISAGYTNYDELSLDETLPANEIEILSSVDRDLINDLYILQDDLHNLLDCNRNYAMLIQSDTQFSGSSIYFDVANINTNINTAYSINSATLAESVINDSDDLTVAYNKIINIIKLAEDDVCTRPNGKTVMPEFDNYVFYFDHADDNVDVENSNDSLEDNTSDDVINDSLVNDDTIDSSDDRLIAYETVMADVYNDCCFDKIHYDEAKQHLVDNYTGKLVDTEFVDNELIYTLIKNTNDIVTVLPSCSVEVNSRHVGSLVGSDLLRYNAFRGRHSNANDLTTLKALYNSNLQGNQYIAKIAYNVVNLSKYFIHVKEANNLLTVLTDIDKRFDKNYSLIVSSFLKKVIKERSTKKKYKRVAA